jgi:hypothetical protein
MRIAFAVLALLASLVSTSAMAQSGLTTVNTVYIEQTGGGSIIDLTQTGLNNEAGNTAKALNFNGDNQRISINQIGNLNVAALDVRGMGSILNSTVTGNNNSVTVNCGITGSTACTDTNIDANATGNNNTIITTTNAKSVTATNITGDSNRVTTVNNTTNTLGAKSDVVSIGDSNVISVTQSGPSGANGFGSKIEVTGGSNNVSVAQGGSVDSNVNIKSTGDSNRITVRSGN